METVISFEQVIRKKRVSIRKNGKEYHSWQYYITIPSILVKHYGIRAGVLAKITIRISEQKEGER